MTAHYDIRDIMLRVSTHLRSTAEAVHTDATVAFYTRDDRQVTSMSESCIENVKRLRDQCDEIIAMAAQAKSRPEAA